MRANGTVVAEQQIAWESTGQQQVAFEHKDASIASIATTKQDGQALTSNGEYRTAEFDELGNDVGITNPYLIDPIEPNEGGSLTPSQQWSSIIDGRVVSFAIDGMPVPRDIFILF